MTDHEDCELEIARLSAELDRLRQRLASNRRARSRAVSIARIWKRRALEAKHAAGAASLRAAYPPRDGRSF